MHIPNLIRGRKVNHSFLSLLPSLGHSCLGYLAILAILALDRNETLPTSVSTIIFLLNIPAFPAHLYFFTDHL
jgi:hypothetical protein